MAKKNPFSGLLTVKAASKFTKLEPWELYAAARSGAVEHHRPSGAKRMIFFTQQALKAYMAKLKKMRVA